jgi:hypothetical protein
MVEDLTSYGDSRKGRSQDSSGDGVSAQAMKVRHWARLTEFAATMLAYTGVYDELR